MKLTETRCESVGWIQLIQDRVQWRAAGNLRKKFRVKKFMEFLKMMSNYQLLKNYT